MTNRKHIAIVGGGASGLMAAISAARAGAAVEVLEAGERVGKPILVSGDGRCNIGNTFTQPAAYRNASFVESAFGVCSPNAALTTFKQLGLLLRQESEGRLYPATGKASTVLDALRAELDRLGVTVRCGCAAKEIRLTGGSWRVTCADGSAVASDAVVISCGGGLGALVIPDALPFIPFKPTLGPLKTNTDPLRGLDKVRARVRLTCGDFCERGEVTFRSYGMSGIVAFNLSRVAQVGKTVEVSFLPDIPTAEIGEFLQARAAALNPRTWEDMCRGMFLPLVSRALLRSCGLDLQDAFNDAALNSFSCAVVAFPLECRGIGDVRLCQAQQGGIDVGAIDPTTMQVRGNDGLYCTGEAIDVDAGCGGFNLQWAWCSGIIAGTSAAKANADEGVRA